MRTNYVLVDYENVQPKDFALLNGQAFKVLMFLGVHQTKLPLDLVKALQAMGPSAEYVHMSSSGHNSLDFHIAFYLGELGAKDPDGYFHVISKDAGIDPLLEHLKQDRGLRTLRSRDLSEIPIVAIPALKTVEERASAAAKNLETRNGRPRTLKTLGTTINALFLRKLEPREVDEVIELLQKRGIIAVEGGKVVYKFS